MRVCVCERERERERNSSSFLYTEKIDTQHSCIRNEEIKMPISQPVTSSLLINSIPQSWISQLMERELYLLRIERCSFELAFIPSVCR